jgi:hypothetical protein
MGPIKRALAVTALAVLFAVPGCYASVQPAFVRASYVPADIELYPHTYYQGRNVYFVNDRYYFRGPESRWVYYRTPPPALVERRRSYVRRMRPYVQRAPAAPQRRYEERRVPPQVRSPEPATRVR